jgi:hypothetical protein
MSERRTDRVRPAAVAGLFYPEDAAELRRATTRHLAAAAADSDLHVAKAFVVPHAGYVYSGPVAATAYAQLARNAPGIRRVVLIGPSHRVGFEGIATSSADSFETPLGVVALDRDAHEKLQELPQVQVLDAAHAQEHSLEVQLPFLQLVLGEFQLVPLLVGDATAEEVSEVIERLWDGPETVVIVSSDLSHYLPYAAGRALDRATSSAIERLAPSEIHFDQACGRLPMQGLLLAARRHGLQARTLDLRSSGDTAGSLDSVVGYGSYAFA